MPWTGKVSPGAWRSFALLPAEVQSQRQGSGMVLPGSRLPLPELPVACRDRDDAVFLHLAVTSNADLLISGDNDLTVLAEIFGSTQLPISGIQSFHPHPNPPPLYAMLSGIPQYIP